jgi:molybdopterin-biosynthesis enzyme MoeA-like protein
VAIARALAVDLVLDQTAVQRYEELRGAPLNEKQLEMCRLPERAQPLFAEATGAPGFKGENIYVLPGVPEILKSIWQRIESQFEGDPQHVETFTTASRESEFAAKMAEYQQSYPDLKFGSYPRIVGDGWEVLIRVRGLPRELVQEAAAKFMADLGGTPHLPEL